MVIETMSTWEQLFRSVLIGPGEFVDRRRVVLIWLIAVGLGGGCYGAVMGGFGGFSGDRSWQILFSAIKVPLLLIATTLLATPSFFVLNTLCGLRNDFGQAFRAVLSTQATVAIILASMAPYTLLWYITTKDYHEATLFNATTFAIASFAAQRQLRHRYRLLEIHIPRHRLMRWMWVVVYAFVGIQMGWFLRPFIGDPTQSPTFLRNGPWGNAYVVVWESIVRVIQR